MLNASHLFTTFVQKCLALNILRAVMGSSISKRTINLNQSSNQILNVDKMSAYILTHCQLFYPNQLRGYFTKPLPKFFPRLSSLRRCGKLQRNTLKFLKVLTFEALIKHAANKMGEELQYSKRSTSSNSLLVDGYFLPHS